MDHLAHLPVRLDHDGPLGSEDQLRGLGSRGASFLVEKSMAVGKPPVFFPPKRTGVSFAMGHHEHFGLKKEEAGDYFEVAQKPPQSHCLHDGLLRTPQKCGRPPPPPWLGILCSICRGHVL